MKRILLGLGLIVCSSAMAVTISDRCALLYDDISTTGPNGKKTRDPGHWIPNITAFNKEASTGKEISCLYPYTGDIEMYCTGPSDCVYTGPKKNVFVYYDVGLPSIKAYHDAFPNVVMLPIIDGSTKSALLKALTYSDVGTNTADLLVEQVCNDPNSDGVFLDLEPFDISVPGQFAFYSQLAKRFVESPCVDTNHPKGRIFGAFLSPGRVKDWSQVKAAFGNVGYAAVSGYDIKDTNPPTPTSIQLYHSSVTGMLTTMDAASTKFKIAYKVVVPWAASFGEFNKYGKYDPSNPPTDFQLIKDYTSEGITQLAYVQAARAIITAVCKSAYYLGMDGWSWSQYKSPKPAEEQMLLPAIPDGDVVKYLQQN